MAWDPSNGSSKEAIILVHVVDQILDIIEWFKTDFAKACKANFMLL